MVIRVQKGQRVDLTRTNPGLKKIGVGLGWVANTNLDLDASAFLLDADGKARGDEAFVFYNNIEGGNGSVVHLGGRGNSAQMRIDLNRVPRTVERIVFTLSIHETDSQRQLLGRVGNAFIYIANDETRVELIRYNLDSEFRAVKAIIVGELYQHRGDWKFNAVGSGFSGGLAGLCRHFGLQIEETPEPKPPTSAQKRDLRKGEKVELTPTKKILVDIGWGTSQSHHGRSFDLNAAAFLLDANGQVASGSDFVYHANPQSANRAVLHRKKRADDGEQFQVDLTQVPKSTQKIALAITRHDASVRRQNFGQSSNVFIRLLNDDTGSELVRYKLVEDFGRETALIVGELYRYRGEWKFSAVGNGFSGGLAALCRHFGLQVNRTLAPEPPNRRLTPKKTGTGNLEFVAKRDLEISTEFIEEHIRLHIGEIGWIAHELKSGAMRLDVSIVEPTPIQDFYTLITTGISDHPMNTASGAEYVELLICLPPSWDMSEEGLRHETNDWPIRLLKTLAQYPHPHHRSLGIEHVVPNGDAHLPYARNTPFCGALLYVPILFAGEFTELEIREGKTIMFLSVIPIYKEELDFAAEHGGGALVERLSASGITEILDINRDNVCQKRRRRFF